MSARCSCCGRELSESPMLTCETLKSLKWEAIEDNLSPTLKSILHSLSCGDLATRSEAVTVVCSQLLPPLCSGHESIREEPGVLGFIAEIEGVVKATGERSGNLLNQQRLDVATSEIQLLEHLATSLLQCAHSKPALTGSLFFHLCCLPSLSHFFTFCRDTETTSSRTFPSISPILGSLFKSSYSLLKLCLEGTERLPVDHTHLTTIISMLAKLAEVAVTFDPSLILLCWKFLAKFVCRAKPHLSDVTATVQPIVEQLSITMETKTKECVMSEGEGVKNQMFLKLLKLCRFLSTLVVKIVLEFEALADRRGFPQKMIQTLLNIQTTILRNSFHGNYWKEYESNILILREPLIQALISSTNFCQRLVDGTMVGEGEHAAWALNLCTLMKLLPTLNDGIQDDIIGETSSREEHRHSSKLPDALFLALHKSYVEVATPIRIGGVMCNGQSQRMVTLYEYILVHLSSLVLILPLRHRDKMEHVLLRYMFSSDPHCSMLAGDAFVFLSRHSPPDSLLFTIHHLSSLVSATPTGHCQLTAVISRLLPLLPPSHLSHLTSSLSSDETPLLSILLASNGHIDAHQIHTHLINQLSTCLADPNPNLVAMRTTLDKLICLLNGSASLPPPLSSLPQLLLSLLSSLPLSSQLASEVLAMAVHLSALLLPFFPPPLLLPLFQALEKLVYLSPLPQPLSLALPRLLKGCGHLTLPHPPRSEVLHIITTLFQTLLQHGSWLAQHLTLDAFKEFAENTPYGEAAEKCIPSDLSDHVINFIHKEPYGRGLVSDVQLQSLLQRHQKNETTPTVSETAPKATPIVSEATPPVDDLVEAWERVSRSVHPSNETLTQLSVICSQMQTFLSQHS